MFSLLGLIVNILISLFKSKNRLEAENAVLRHQVTVLRRQVAGRVHLTNLDRLFLVQLYRWFPSCDQKIETTERPVVHGTTDSKADFPAALVQRGVWGSVAALELLSGTAWARVIAARRRRLVELSQSLPGARRASQ